MNLRSENHQAVSDWIRAIQPVDARDDAMPGERRAVSGSGFGFFEGGQFISDGFASRRAPSGDNLIDRYRGIGYACARINANAVSRTALRLYVTTTRSEPRARCMTRPATLATRDRLERMSYSAPSLCRGIETDLAEVVAHPLIDLMRRVNDSPDNPFAGMQSLIFYLQLCKEITANAYWRHGRDGLDTPSQIFPLDPRVKVVPFARPQSDGRIIDHYLDVFGEKIAPEEIARFRFLSPRNPYVASMGPMEAAYQELGVRDKFDASIEAILGNAFHPSAIISSKSPDHPIGPDSASRLAADLRKAATRGKSGGIVFNPDALDYTPWTQQQADVGGLAVSKDAKETIANCFDVPTTLLAMQSATRASAEAGNYAHAVNGVAPRCEQLAEEITAITRRLDMTGGLNWHRLIWAFDNPIPADEEREMKVAVGYVGAGILVPDEARADMGRGPRPDGKGNEVREPRPALPAPADAKGGSKTQATDDAAGGD